MKMEDKKKLKKIIDENPDWVTQFNSLKPTEKEFKFHVSPMRTNQPHKCPVCGGRGIVPNGWYTSTMGQWSTTSASPEQCRTCNGKGIVWS